MGWTSGIPEGAIVLGHSIHALRPYCSSFTTVWLLEIVNVYIDAPCIAKPSFNNVYYSLSILDKWSAGFFFYFDKLTEGSLSHWQHINSSKHISTKWTWLVWVRLVVFFIYILDLIVWIRLSYWRIQTYIEMSLLSAFIIIVLTWTFRGLLPTGCDKVKWNTLKRVWVKCIYTANIKVKFVMINVYMWAYCVYHC